MHLFAFSFDNYIYNRAYIEKCVFAQYKNGGSRHSYDHDAFWEEHYRSEHKDKTDDELRQIVLNNSRKGTAMPTSATPKMIADAKVWLAEAKACNAILASRRESAAERKAAIEQWEQNQESDKLKAILNLPTGITPNGQLVAAILEDEGADMTAQEIAGWCDELGELEDADLQTLLDNLQKERIIGKKDDKYFLRQAVTGTLYPEHCADWTAKDLEEVVRPRKAVSPENLTQIQLDNERLKDVIYSVLVNDGGLMAITDIMQADPELENISNQRCSALVRQLLTDGQVERVESERKAFFRAVK